MTKSEIDNTRYSPYEKKNAFGIMFYLLVTSV